MFARGPRFPPEKPSEAPGPGHYKLPEESRLEAYKKGAFLEKADRFSTEKGNDVPGPGTYNTAPQNSNPRPGPSKSSNSNQGLAHLQQQIESLKSQNARLLKEHQQAVRKYEDKVVHNESTIKSLVKDNVALQSQVSTQQKEHRMVCQRELALRTALEKAETSHKGETDRASKLAGLQRKLQDLEKIYADEKKKHQVEVDQLKSELDGSRKAVTEHDERLSLLRKQQDISESRMKDLKKTIIADQAEIKDLRAKARDAGQVKGQALSRQVELDQLKKALQSLETKHKVELHSRDIRMSELERTLAAGHGKMEALELQAGNLKSKAETEAEEARNRNRHLEDELDTLRRSADDAKSTASESASHLNNLHTTMVRVVEEYGRLAASSVSLAVHRQTQLECASLRLRNIRLERRLADRDVLAEQLTDYCRQASDEKTLLASILRETEEDHRALQKAHTIFHNDVPSEETSLELALLRAQEDDRQMHGVILQCDIQTAQVIAQLYQTAFDDLLVSYALAHRENIEENVVATRLIDAHSALQAEIDALRFNYRTVETELSRKSAQIAEAIARERVLDRRLANHKTETIKLEETLRKERDSNARLVQVVHQSKKNEDVLRLEVDELVEDLADATRFKEAHADLLAEVVDLIQRNELAEAEADRLGKFNAEILGHANPHQKILYVDRIRRELADTKHQLMQSTRDREGLAADNAALYHEVATYKSIAVPIENKPRSNRVRIERAPLASRGVNGLAQSIAFEFTPPDEEPIDTSPMTLDEIM